MRTSRGALLALFSGLLALSSGSLQAAAANLPKVTARGPFAVNKAATEATLVIGGDVSPACSRNCSLKLYLTSPKRTASLGRGSLPIIIMFDGFELPSYLYTEYALSLASWGFAALQFDLPGLLPWLPWPQAIIRDDEEVKFVPEMIKWLKQQSEDPQSPVYQLLDFNRVGAFGHSRGGKLAAFTLAYGTGGVSAAALIDPVDMTQFTADYPSAVDALKQHPHNALLVGAGIQGACNPKGEGWDKFSPVVLPQAGSWQMVVDPAGHMQFLDTNHLPSIAPPIPSNLLEPIVNFVLNGLCGGKYKPQADVVTYVKGAAVAWLLQELKPEESEKEVAEWLAWVPYQEASRGLNWTTQAAARRTAAPEPVLVGASSATGGADDARDEL